MLQTVQRAKYWGVILALQAFFGKHIGIDDINCDFQGRKINFTNSKTLVGRLVGVATDRDARLRFFSFSCFFWWHMKSIFQKKKNILKEKTINKSHPPPKTNKQKSKKEKKRGLKSDYKKSWSRERKHFETTLL